MTCQGKNVTGAMAQVYKIVPLSMVIVGTLVALLVVVEIKSLATTVTAVGTSRFFSDTNKLQGGYTSPLENTQFICNIYMLYMGKICSA